jgi:protein NrfD
VTFVFFLFLLHASLGLMAVLAAVPDRAGAKFFKLCAASAAFMTTAGWWMLWRRGGGSAALLWTTGAFLVLTVLYNRARHFDWKRAHAPLLGSALAAGVAALLAADSAGPPPGTESVAALLVATDLTSALLMGTAAGAMILGHYYLVVLDLPIAALRRLTVLLVIALGLRTVVVAVVLLGPLHGGLDEARAVALGLWSPDGVFVWMRLLFGIAGPLSLVWFIWKTVEIRSTQSATGILYVQLFLVMAGELLAKYLRMAAGIPL